MSTDTATAPPLGRTQKFIDGYLRGMEARGELVEGARALLLKHGASYRDPEKALADLTGFLEGDGRGLLAPRPADAPRESPLLAMLRRMTHLKPGAAETLAAQWVELALLPAHQMASAVAGRLDNSREVEQHLSERPELDGRGRAVLDVLNRLAAEFAGDWKGEDARREVARSWGVELSGYTGPALTRAVINRLRLNPHHGEQVFRGGGLFEVDGAVADDFVARTPKPDDAQMREQLQSIGAGAF